MRKQLWSLILVGLLVFPAAVRADDAMKKALSVIPADAVGFICVPNVKQLDASFQRTVQQLNLQGFVSPPFNSLAAVMRQFGGLGEGFNEDGPLALVLMPANNHFELMMKQAVIVSASDPRKLLEGMGATPGEGGVWTAPVMGQPMNAAAGEGYVVFGQMSDVVKAAAEGKNTIQGKFNQHDLDSLSKLNLAIWLDGDRLIKTFRPQIDQMLNMMAMMQGAGGPMGAAQGEMSKKQLSMLVDGAAALTLGVGLGDTGLALQLGFRAKADSELAKGMKYRQTSESLLRGLPGDEYLFAMGMTADPSAAEQAIKQLDGYMAMGEQIEGIDKAQLGKLKDIIKSWAPMSTGARFVLSPIAPGVDGVVGMAFVFDTPDSTKWMEAFGNAIETAMSLPKNKDDLDDEFKQVLEALSFRRDVEEVAGTKVHQLKIDLSKIDDVDEDDVEQMQKLLGQDGFVLRAGAVTDKNAIMTFGGGTKYFGSVVEQTRSKAAPLDGEAGIQSVARHLPKERYSVGYVDVDRIIRFIGDVSKIMDEDDAFPIQMPKVDAPLVMTFMGGDSWQSNQIFIPTELMVATKDLIMGWMGGGPGAPPPPPPGGN
jgi:hypothetical protein